MSNYTSLENGARGEEVKKLQQALESAGYSVGATGVDGIYGKNTQAAVQRYQNDNGITGTGVADAATLKKLYGVGEQTEPDVYTEAKEKLEQVKAEKPTFSGDDSALEALSAQLKNYPSFEYDPMNDPLYESMRSRYIHDGRLAMLDAAAQAATLTGGYGSTYSQQVGQQTYDEYLTALNAHLPTLRQQAYDTWADGRDHLLTDYGLEADRYNTAWDRYQQELDDYYKALSAARGEEETAWERRQQAATLAASAGDYSLLQKLYGLTDSQLAGLTTGKSAGGKKEEEPEFDILTGRKAEIEEAVEGMLVLAYAAHHTGSGAPPLGAVFSMVEKYDRFYDDEERAYASAYLTGLIEAGKTPTNWD